MELFFFILLLILLIIFGYTQLQKDVIKIPGNLTINDDEEIKLQQ